MHRTHPPVLALAPALVCLFIAASAPAQILPLPVERTVGVDLVKRFGGTVSDTERVYLQLPASPSGQDPLLLVFHGLLYDRHWLSKSGNNHHDAELTALMSEAASRGWIAASLEGGRAPDFENPTYGSPELHQRVTAVVDDLDQTYGIDPDRIYTIGYSMGGADALGYAARHQDPQRWRIAAAFSWSGVLDTTYGLAGPVMERLYWADGPPASSPLPYVASSTVRYSSCSPITPIPDQSLIFNLRNVPVKITHASDPTKEDPTVLCCYAAAEALAQQFNLANIVFDPAFLVGHHDFTGFDASAVCDFFDGVSLPPTQLQATHRTIAVEDVRYVYFRVRLASPAAPAAFTWSFPIGANTLSLTGVSGLGGLELRVDGSSAITTPLVSTQPLVIDCTDTTDKVELYLKHFLTAPGTVLLDGNAAGTDDWDYDAATKTLRLKAKPDQTPGAFRWEIQ